MFPWLRSYPGGLQLSEETMSSSNGLFFQQLYAFTLIGKKTPVSASKRKEKDNQEAFLNLLQSYVMGTYEGRRIDSKAGRCSQCQLDVSRCQCRGGPHHTQLHHQHSQMLRPLTPTTSSSLSYDPRDRRTSSNSSNQMYGSRDYQSPVGQRHADFPPERDHSSFSDSGSDNNPEADTIPLRVNPLQPSSPYHESMRPSGMQSPSSPSMGMASSSYMSSSASTSRSSLVLQDNPLEDMENVFDIVFKQQAIGMKLGADESKQFAVVKECFEGSEAKRYPEIQNGVVILAVNGQEVAGLGLSRILYRLREAPRPVVVRFGRISRRQKPGGTWG